MIHIPAHGDPDDHEIGAVVVETVDLSDTNSDKEEEDSSVVADSNEEEEEDDDSSSNAGDDHEVSQSLYPVDSEGTISNAEVVGGGVKSMLYYHPQEEHEIRAVKEHGLTFCESIKYKDEVVHGVRERSYGRIKFNGWGTIRRSNMLKENDIVHCEMLHIRKKVHSIKIRITHG
ncbi:unnamed protein product [Brassica rapa subsp. narinosa]